MEGRIGAGENAAVTTGPGAFVGTMAGPVHQTETREIGERM